MSREPADVPGSAQPAADLTWTEVGDAVWLAAATGGARSSRASRQVPNFAAARPPASGDHPPSVEDRDHSPDSAGGHDDESSRSVDDESAARPNSAEASAGNGEILRASAVEEESADVRGSDADTAKPAARHSHRAMSSGRGETSRLSRSEAQPITPPLPEKAIMRALRPFKRRIPSWLEEDLVLDEEATAERAAHDNLWLPVTKPSDSRWLDLTVIIEDSPTTALWRSRSNAFVALVERLAAFRDIRTCLLNVRSVDGRSVPALRGGSSQSAPKSPAEIIDPGGRRIILVLTDCFSPIWRNNSVSAMLARLSRLTPTAVVDLMPQRVWHRVSPMLCRARLTTPGPMAPNRKWSVEWLDAWADPEFYAACVDSIPIPVLEMETRWLGWWASLVTGDVRSVDSVVMPVSATRPGDTPPGGLIYAPGVSGRDLATYFRGAAAPLAYRLATLLAAVPVNLSLARLIQAEFLPESDLSHLAEVVTSGLLYPVESVLSEQSTNIANDMIDFEFRDDVRAELLHGARRSETAAVIRLAASRMPGWAALLGDFSAGIEAPDTTPDPDITVASASYAAIEQVVFRALSGPYLSRAGRLGDSLGRLLQAGAQTLLRSSPAVTTTSDRESHMSDTAASRNAPTYRAGGDGEQQAETSAEQGSRVPPQPGHGDRPTSAQLGSTPFGLAPPRERPGEEIPPVWGNIPPRNPNFTGREEFLTQLRQRLAAGGTTAVLPAALHGMGGIGKTQIAIEYIYRHLRDYDLIWWIQAVQPAQVRASLTELAQRLHLPGSTEAHTAVPVVREALRVGQPFDRWLLVFDSAESPESVRQFFPTNGPGQILITSRNPDWAGMARPLELEVFKRAESIELLQRRGPVINDAEADQLGEKLGDLPLAIEQAAAWRAETGMPVREYLRLFDEKVSEILDASSSTDYEVSVAAAWNVSFDELRKRNPAAHQLIQVCAFFSPEPIARTIFSGVRGISIAAELDQALRDPMQLSRAIRDINRYGLAKIDHRHDTIQLHRLVQLVLRNRMTPQHRAEIRHGAHLLLANLDPNDPIPSTQWQKYQDILSHAYASDVLDCEDRWVGQLVINLMTFLYYLGDHEEAAALAGRAVDKWSTSRGEDDPLTLRAAANLSSYLWTLGRHTEAAEINRRTLEFHRRISGEESEETLTAQTAVAADLKAAGDFAGARDLSEEIYQKARGLFGEDDPTTLLTAHRFAVSLRLAGEYQRARLLDEDTYGRRVEVLGYDNADTISTLSGLILDRREAGEYAWAHAEQERLVERVRALFGNDRAVTLRRLLYLSVARRKDGDHQGALDLSGEILERFRLRYGDGDQHTLASALAHSIDQRHAGDLTASRDLGERTFNGYRENFGEHHPHTLAAAIGLAVTLRTAGDTSSARQLDERSLEQLRSSLGPDHPSSVVCAIDLASDLAAMGEYEAALALDSEAVERAQKVLGIDHPTALAARSNALHDLRAMGRSKEAETRFAELITHYRRVLGEAHPGTIAFARGARADCDIDPLPL